MKTCGFYAPLYKLGCINICKECKNWGRGSDKWHADHIIACAEFDMNNEEEVKKCFHYTNYQPLWEPENLKKSSKNAEGKKIYKRYKKSNK